MMKRLLASAVLGLTVIADVAGDTPVAPVTKPDGWPTASATTVKLSPDRLTAMESAIQSGEFQKITSILIARHGKLVYEAYFNGAEADSLHDTRSVTKTVTGILVGIAIEKGLLADVNAPVLKFFPDKQPVKNPDPRKEAILVEDLLTMRSPLDADDNDDKSPGHEDRMSATKDWIQFALDLPIRELPGTKTTNTASAQKSFHYSAAGVVTLGGVLDRATGAPVPEFARKELFAPLGIEKAEWSFSPSGQAMTAGGLRLRSRDLLKLGQLYANDGLWNSNRVVSKSWVAKSTEPHVRVNAATEYGYLWWLRAFPAGGKKLSASAMLGNGGNMVAVFPEPGLVVVVTSTNFNVRRPHELTNRLLTEFILPSIEQ